MKYTELDGKKWDWLKKAIIKHDWITVQADSYKTSIQVTGLFVFKNILFVIDIIGEEHRNPQKCKKKERGALIIK